MTEVRQIYKCNVCGNIVEILHEGVGSIICCNQPMQLQEERTEGEGQEKHVPVMEKSENEITIKVGNNPHPMDEKHYIEWIEAIANGKSCRKSIYPHDKPETRFKIEGDKLEIRAYCNQHGLWKRANQK